MKQSSLVERWMTERNIVLEESFAEALRVLALEYKKTTVSVC